MELKKNWIMDFITKLIEFEPILEKKSFATFATLSPSGHLHNVPLWFYYDRSKHIFKISVEENSVKDKNIQKNPNVSLTITDPDNPYHYVQIIGKVIKREPDTESIFSLQLYKKYSDNKVHKILFDYPNPLLILTIEPVRVTGWAKESAYNFLNFINTGIVN